MQYFFTKSGMQLSSVGWAASFRNPTHRVQYMLGWNSINPTYAADVVLFGLGEHQQKVVDAATKLESRPQSIYHPV